MRVGLLWLGWGRNNPCLSLCFDLCVSEGSPKSRLVPWNRKTNIVSSISSEYKYPSHIFPPPPKKESWKPWKWHEMAKAIPCPLFFPWDPLGLVSWWLEPEDLLGSQCAPSCCRKVSSSSLRAAGSTLLLLVSLSTCLVVSWGSEALSLFHTGHPMRESWNASHWAFGE